MALVERLGRMTGPFVCRPLNSAQPRAFQRKGSEHMPGTKRAWSAQDDVALLILVEEGLAIGEIAGRVGRTAAECRARLDHITKASDGVFPRETAAS